MLNHYSAKKGNLQDQNKLKHVKSYIYYLQLTVKVPVQKRINRQSTANMTPSSSRVPSFPSFLFACIQEKSFSSYKMKKYKEYFYE